MGFLDSLRKAISGPARVKGTDDPGEAAVAMREEFAVPNAGDDEIEQIEELSSEPAAPVAAAPFSGVGQADAAELEDTFVSEEEEEPEHETGPIDPAP